MIDTLGGVSVEVCDYMIGTHRAVKAFGIIHVSKEWFDEAKAATPEELQEMCFTTELVDMDAGGLRDPFGMPKVFGCYRREK